LVSDFDTFSVTEPIEKNEIRPRVARFTASINICDISSFHELVMVAHGGKLVLLKI